MQQSCQKCGAEVKAEQAFCSKCGAVVGMGDAAARKGSDEWDMASTFVSKKSGTAPLQRPGVTGERARPITDERARPSTGESAAAPTHDAAAAARPDAAAAKPARGGNTLIFALRGVVAILIAGGLLILLLYMNSKG
jgi:hypothetical protein